ncbi:MAG TPA: response regulator [Longimicrobiales bacterium]|nr:response regulator [Longimicrobiales bacterium]
MGLNVLIVDDSAVMRAVIMKTLGMSGVPLGTLYQAGNGEQALALLKENPVDLIMLDISMPVMRGDEVLERVRVTPGLEGLPVVVVSSERSGERMDRMRDLGAEFVSKPFAPEQLRSILMTMGELREAICAE